MPKTFLCFLTALILLISVPGAAKGTENSYTVNKGENLYRISLKTGTPVDTIMSTNQMADTNIYPGQVLKLPLSNNRETYVVQAGDNLFRIALRYSTSIQEIKNANNLANDIIDPGQSLYIPVNKPVSSPSPASAPEPVPTANQETAPAENVAAREKNKGTATTQVAQYKTMLEGSSAQAVSHNLMSEADKQLLAKLIYAEARGETQEGKTAVGAVIINRLKSPQFPKSIRDIIYEKRGSVYQFSPVENGSINMEPDTAAFKAADEALQGVDPSNGALFFYNPEKTNDKWIRTLPEKRRIGNHIFAK